MMFKLACYFPGPTPLFIPINIEADVWLTELRHAIQMKLKLNGLEVSPRDLLLFKTDVPLDPQEDLQSRALQWLHTQPANSHLPEKKLASLFPNGPRLIDDQLDIIVSNGEVLELAEDLSNLDVYQREVKKALNDCLNRFPLTPSPSSIVRSSHTPADILGGKMPSIHLGRPGGVPVTIFNPALASLQRCLDNLEEVRVTRSEVELAAKYLCCAVAFYKDEALRQSAIKELVDEMIGEQGEWGSILVGRIISNPTAVGGTRVFSFWSWSSKIHWACPGMHFHKRYLTIAKSSREGSTSASGSSVISHGKSP